LAKKSIKNKHEWKLALCFKSLQCVMEDVGQNITRAIVDELTSETFQGSRPWMCNEAIKG
jgi:hypothetical protein